MRLNHQPTGKGILGDAYRWTANKLFSGEKLREGETHVPQLDFNWEKGFSIKNASYAGPGTHVINRVREGVKPVNTADKASLAHDIRYSLAPEKNTKQAIREADNKMVSKLVSESSIWHPIDSINNLVAAAGIKGKTLLEDWGIAGADTFTKTSEKKKLSQADESLLRGKLSELEKEGYGAPIQSILISRSVPKSEHERIILGVGGHKGKVDVTQNYFRYR